MKKNLIAALAFVSANCVDLAMKEDDMARQDIETLTGAQAEELFNSFSEEDQEKVQLLANFAAKNASKNCGSGDLYYMPVDTLLIALTPEQADQASGVGAHME